VSVKHGTHVHYSVRDPRVFELLESARTIIVSHLDETRALLEELSASEALPTPLTENGPAQ